MSHRLYFRDPDALVAGFDASEGSAHTQSGDIWMIRPPRRGVR